MAHKFTGQASFVEAFLRPHVGANWRLEGIERMIAQGAAGCASQSAIT